ncbi:MAG: glycosyltransferase family 39 protein [Chloroflexi bacterium]|nr:glycosyltransferase family 39 protein [Chloroflexota bacterium]
MNNNLRGNFSSFILHPSSFGKFITLPFFILLAFLLFALAPLTAPGYFSNAHDARHSVFFLQMFDQSIRDGAWYPRWAADMVFGYGYPLWLILAPIPFFVGEAFHLGGFDFVTAVKIVDGLALLFSAINMYLFTSRVLGKNAGLIAAIAYAYIPYHLVDLYVRAAQAELVAFAFPPLVCWAFYELATTQRIRYIGVAALAYAGLLLSHISMAALFSPIIGLYMLFLLFVVRPPTADGRPPSSLRFALYASLAIALALGLAAIFLLPILTEQKYLTSDPLIGGFFNYRKHFLNASQLLSPMWGYGYAGENGTDQFSLQLGLIPVLLTFVALWAFDKTRKIIRTHIAFFVVILIAMVFAMLPISAPLWEPFASIVAFTQFPWRLLIVSAFSLAFLSGAAIHALPDDAHDLAPILGIALLFVVANYNYTEPQHTDAVFNYQAQMEFEVKDRELLGDTIWMTGDRPQDSPLVDQYINGQPLEKAIALDDGATVKTIRTGGQSTDVQVEGNAATRVLVYTRYFPGWTATINHQATEVKPYGDQGLILVNVPAGSHIVRLRFEDTINRQLGAVISGVSLLIALGIIKFRDQSQK